MSIFAIRQFSWRRLGLFIKSDLVINSSKIFTFGMTIFVALLLCGLTNSTEFLAGDFDPSVFIVVLFIGGLWATSKSFADLHDQEKSISFLLLPVSNLEKLLGRWLLTAVGYVVGIVLIFYIVLLLVAGFFWLAFGRIPVIFWSLPEGMLYCFTTYILQHSMFFLGAIYFKSSIFSKTILSLCVLVLSFFLVAFIIFGLFLGVDFFNGWWSLIHFSATVKLIFAVMTPLGAWLLAYLRLCESEI